MSKLIDKLDKMTQGDIKPFGFAASVTKSTAPQMLIIARTKLDDDAKTIPIIDAEAVLLSVDDASKTVDTVNRIGKERLADIWGIEAKNVSKKEADQLAKTGCDFIVLKLTSPTPVLMSDENLAKVIQINSSIEESMIKALNSLPVDALIVQDDSNLQDFTVENLVMYSRLEAMAQQPLLLVVSLELAKDNLEVLRDTGVNGLILDWSGAASNKKFAEIKKAIESLPKSKKKKKGHANAVLPNLSSATYEEDGDPEE